MKHKRILILFFILIFVFFLVFYSQISPIRIFCTDD